MELRQELAQKQALSQRMIQSAQILQMGTQELERYLRELATENPLAELEGRAAWRGSFRPSAGTGPAGGWRRILAGEPGGACGLSAADRV